MREKLEKDMGRISLPTALLKDWLYHQREKMLSIIRLGGALSRCVHNVQTNVRPNIVQVYCTIPNIRPHRLL